MRKQKIQCDMEVDNEKHASAQYKCPECDNNYCKKCSMESGCECLLCNPRLIDIK